PSVTLPDDVSVTINDVLDDLQTTCDHFAAHQLGQLLVVRNDDRALTAGRDTAQHLLGCHTAVHWPTPPGPLINRDLPVRMHIASRTHGNDLAPETRYFVALLDSFGDLRDLSGVSRPVGAGVVERGSTVGDEVDGVILDAAGHVIGNLFQTPFPVRATMITAGELHVTDCFPYRF